MILSTISGCATRRKSLEEWLNSIGNNTTPSYDTSGAIVKISSGGNTLAFYGDGTYTASGIYTGLGFDVPFSVKDTYSVSGDTLRLGCGTQMDITFLGIPMTLIPKSYASVSNGALYIYIVGNNGTENFRLGTFGVGKADAEKLGIGGVNSDASEETEPQQPTEPLEPEQPAAQVVLNVTDSLGNTLTFYGDGSLASSGTYTALSKYNR